LKHKDKRQKTGMLGAANAALKELADAFIATLRKRPHESLKNSSGGSPVLTKTG
jgi:hypothetical protein